MLYIYICVYCILSFKKAHHIIRNQQAKVYCTHLQQKPSNLINSRDLTFLSVNFLIQSPTSLVKIKALTLMWDLTRGRKGEGV